MKTKLISADFSREYFMLYICLNTTRSDKIIWKPYCWNSGYVISK